MDEQRWEDLEMDCLVKVLEKVGMESLLLDVPFVCKFASEYQIDGDRCSVSAFLKFLINRSSGNATVLKLPKCCTVEAFEFAANVCPGLVTSSLPVNLLDNKHTNQELIGKWKNLEVLSLYSSKGSVHGREALSIVKLVPNIKYLNLKGAKVNRDGLVTLLHGCKNLVMLDARDCSGFNENDDEISKFASHISKIMCEGSEFPEFLRGMDNFVLLVDGYSFHLHVEETWDEMLNDLRDAFNDFGRRGMKNYLILSDISSFFIFITLMSNYVC
ncbi:hypothetical protein CerSpe_004440 [Prunus speciosa]